MIQRYLTSVIPLLMVQAIGIAQDEVCSVPLDVAASVAKIEGRLGEGKNELDLTPLIEANFGIAVPLMDEGFVVDGIASPREYAQSNACSISFADNQNPGKPLPAQSELITEGGTDDDLSLRLHMGYTEEALYLSYIVTDDFLGRSATQ